MRNIKPYYKRIIVEYCDIDGKERSYTIDCVDRNTWADRFSTEWARLLQLKEQGEILDFVISSAN